ncbi:hypothetical protein AVEN_170287-1, partial [Araneus ventricosus]
ICKKLGITDVKLPTGTIIDWLKQAGIIGKETGISESDVNKILAKVGGDEKISFEELQTCIVNLAEEKGINPKELMDKLTSSGPPQMGVVKEMVNKFLAKFKK